MAKLTGFRYASGEVKNKIKPVWNSTCWKCYQNFKNDCRANQVPKNEEEGQYRQQGPAVCLGPTQNLKRVQMGL